MVDKLIAAGVLHALDELLYVSIRGASTARCN